MWIKWWENGVQSLNPNAETIIVPRLEFSLLAILMYSKPKLLTSCKVIPLPNRTGANDKRGMGTCLAFHKGYVILTRLKIPALDHNCMEKSNMSTDQICNTVQKKTRHHPHPSAGRWQTKTKKNPNIEIYLYGGNGYLVSFRTCASKSKQRQQINVLLSTLDRVLSNRKIYFR